MLESNPYANLDASAASPFELSSKATDLRYQSDELSEYCLPEHKHPIEYFKILHHDIYECEKRYLSNIILTFTGKNEVFLWSENLMSVRDNT